MNYKLSPSDLTFSYEGCKRCYYQKVVNVMAAGSDSGLYYATVGTDTGLYC